MTVNVPDSFITIILTSRLICIHEQSRFSFIATSPLYIIGNVINSVFGNGIGLICSLFQLKTIISRENILAWKFKHLPIEIILLTSGINVSPEILNAVLHQFIYLILRLYYYLKGKRNMHARRNTNRRTTRIFIAL